MKKIASMHFTCIKFITIIFFMQFVFTQETNAQQNIDSLEFGVDNIAAFGQAVNKIPITPVPVANAFPFNVNISSVSNGIHTLYVRTHSTTISSPIQGYWSETNYTYFYKQNNVTSSVSTVQKVEYFIDTDPGIGSGINIPITPATQVSGISFNPNISALSNGFHVLFIRSLDANGKWSITNYTYFYKQNNVSSSVSTVQKVEYFIDTDPGIGSAINIPITTATQVSGISFSPNIGALPNGFHVLFIRSLDANGKWSITNYQYFYKQNNVGTPVSIVSKMEYFIDTDPGAGSGKPIIIVPATNIAGLNFNADISSIASGFHVIFIRSLDANGKWSITNYTYIFKAGPQTATAANIVKVEYYIDTDPGYFSATDIPITAAPDIPNKSFSANITGLSVGKHNLFTRSLDSRNKWSVNAFDTFRIGNAPPLPPTVTASGPTTFCQGGSVTLTSSASSGNQWYKDGTAISGAVNQTYVANQSGSYTVIVTVNGVSSSPSSPVNVVVTPSVTPSVTIAASATTICAGTNVTFTATPINGGTNASYQWKINGVNAGTNSNTFSSATLNNNDVVTVVITSNATCASPTTATSNAITITVNSSVTPSVTIAASATTICAGTNVTFTATPTNGGTTPSYQWKVNGVNAGTNNNTFSLSTLNNNDVVTVVMTSNATCASPTIATSNAITITVNSSVTPSVTIAASATTICAGTNVTFTATPINGGTSPSYQWKVNGVNAGTNGNTFSSATLNNNDVVTVVMTSNATCTTTATATSNAITITVTPAVTPSISIAASATTICAGTNVTFTATPINGGTNPSYQWKVNGVNAGTNSITFSSSTLNNNDVVTVVITSNATCASPTTATSNAITITVTPAVIPSVSIAASATNICAGSNVTFNATPTNGGTLPSYQWKVNGVNAGPNSNTFSSSTLNNNDVVTVVMTSNAACVTTTTATSNMITITVSPLLTPSVNISATQTTICAGTSVTFTATPTNGGTAPVYQWKVNGVNAGTNSNTFSSSTLTNNAVVTVVLTSNATCIITPTATSNAITITVTSSVTPLVNITASATTICAGSNVTFTAIPTNGGTSPSYQWKVNGVNAGTNSNTFSSSTLNNNDVVTVVMTSNATCASPATATSNAIAITVVASVTPSVSIAASATTICAGTSVTFTATQTNGGTTPAYQWKVNGVNAGTNSNTFSSSTLNNNDVVTVVITSNASCTTTPIATSNAITITVTAPLTPSVTIAASATTICAGSSVTFTATPTNGGTLPSYQWKVNGVNAGTNSNTFSSSTLTNNAVVTVVLTSNAGCVTTSTATSNAITITVTNPVSPSVTIAASATAICAGATVTFTATTVNGGATPTYQWRVNGNNAGTNSSTFSSSTFNNNDVITVVLTSNAGCTTTPTATSNAITITVNPNPVVNAGADKTIQQGDSVRLDATATISSGTINILWTPASALNNASLINPIAKPATTITYKITVTSAAGCSASDDVIVTVLTGLNIPHGFSPNGDGVNDTWNIRGISTYPNCIMQIFDRYGRTIFYSAGYNTPWDGRYKGKFVPVDTYYYILDLKNGSQVLSGFVTIIK